MWQSRNMLPAPRSDRRSRASQAPRCLSSHYVLTADKSLLKSSERAPSAICPAYLRKRKACAGGDAAHAAEQSAADFAEQRAQNLAADLLDVLRRESVAERREQLLHVVAVELEAVTRAASVAR